MSRSHTILICTLVLAVVLAGCAAPKATPTPAPTAVPPQAPTSAPTEAPTAAPTQPAGPQPVKGGTLVVSHGRNVADTLNQHTSIYTVSRMVARHVLDTLVAVNPADGSINPCLATSWEISPDGRVYTFKLRQDVKFHDGTPFNAEAVKFNFDYTARPDVRHGFAWSAIGGENYEKCEVVDEYTVKIYFKEPNSAFLLSLSDGGLGIDSPTAMQQAGEDYGVKVLVGTGPFKFKEWVKDDHTTLVRNDEYNWAPAFFKHQGPPYLDEIVYRDVQDVATRVAALEAGELHVATVTEPFVAQLRANKDLQIVTTPKAGTSRMFTMNLGKPPTDDIRVRRAINHAINKEALLQLPAWSGIGKVAIAPLPSNMVPNGDLSSLKPYDYEYNPEKAKALLEEAGWKVGADGIREKDGQKLVLDMVTTATSVPQVEPIEQMLREVGIKMNIRTGDFNFWISECEKGNYNITLMSDSGYNSLFLLEEFWLSTSAGNWQAYKNPVVDEQLAKMRAATTQEDYWKAAFAVMAETMKDAQAVNAWEQQYIYGASAKVHDIGFNEIGFPFFYDTWIEK
ncbi:MAG: ABC transporter substrate-binding protein [Anaerolineae bacterium]